MNDKLIKLTGLYENTSERTGKTYFVGYLGGAKVLLLKDDKAEAGQPTWGLFIAERPERKTTNPKPRDNGARQRQAPAGDWQRPFDDPVGL